jgi:filamentous hemagglutinin
MPGLRNADRAIIDERKVRDYVLNMDDPVGRNKARVIRAATGLTRVDYPDLVEQIRQAVLTGEAESIEPIAYGERFRVTMTVSGPKGTLRVRTGWIYRVGEDVPRFVTLYPLS